MRQSMMAPSAAAKKIAFCRNKKAIPRQTPAVPQANHEGRPFRGQRSSRASKPKNVCGTSGRTSMALATKEGVAMSSSAASMAVRGPKARRLSTKVISTTPATNGSMAKRQTSSVEECSPHASIRGARAK